MKTIPKNMRAMGLEAVYPKKRLNLSAPGLVSRYVVSWKLSPTLEIDFCLENLGTHFATAYQESFSSQFKIDLGDQNRFSSLGELVYEIAKTIWRYNHTRIHTVIKMPPAVFATRQRNLSEFHYKERGA